MRWAPNFDRRRRPYRILSIYARARICVGKVCWAFCVCVSVSIARWKIWLAEAAENGAKEGCIRATAAEQQMTGGWENLQSQQALNKINRISGTEMIVKIQRWRQTDRQTVWSLNPIINIKEEKLKHHRITTFVLHMCESSTLHLCSIISTPQMHLRYIYAYSVCIVFL